MRKEKEEYVALISLEGSSALRSWASQALMSTCAGAFDTITNMMLHQAEQQAAQLGWCMALYLSCPCYPVTYSQT